MRYGIGESAFRVFCGPCGVRVAAGGVWRSWAPGGRLRRAVQHLALSSRQQQRCFPVVQATKSSLAHSELVSG